MPRPGFTDEKALEATQQSERELEEAAALEAIAQEEQELAEAIAAYEQEQAAALEAIAQEERELEVAIAAHEQEEALDQELDANEEQVRAEIEETAELGTSKGNLALDEALSPGDPMDVDPPEFSFGSDRHPDAMDIDPPEFATEPGRDASTSDFQQTTAALSRGLEERNREARGR